MGSISGGWRGPGIVGDGLVLYLDAGSPSSYLTEFGTVWKDMSGNGNTGTLTNGPTYDSGSGGSFMFNGVNTYVDCGNRASLAPGTGDFTIEFWINATNWTNTYAALLTTTVTNGLWIGKNASNFVLRAYNVADDLQYATLPTTNTWTHIIITRNSSIASIYYNAASVVSGTVTRGYLQGTTEISRDGISSVFNGKISAVRYYNRALSSSEIIQNYNAQCTRFGLTPILTNADTDAAAFFTRVTAAGGTLTNTEQTAINTLVLSLKANNLWTSILAIYPMVGASAAACAQNLKSSSYTGTFSSGWTYASTGVTPNGTNAFMNTGLIPSTALTIANWHLSYYSRTSTSLGFETCMGVGDYLGLYSTSLFARRASDTAAFDSSNSSALIRITAASTNGSGFYNGIIRSTTDRTYFKNGVSIVSSTTSNANTLPSYNLILGGYYNFTNLVAQDFTNKQCAFASIGAGLSDTDAATFYTLVQAFQTSLSRQV